MMNSNILSMHEYLKNKGIRVTKQRQAILKILLDRNYPLTANHIYSMLEDRFPQLRLSTVYRNLNMFVDKNLVRKMELDPNNKESYFELSTGEHHHHLLCVKCNEIVPLDCPLKEYEKTISNKTDYTLIDHKIKIYGICPKCKNE